MKNILIIGATGSTGFYLAEHLSSFPHKYSVFATGRSIKAPNLFKSNVTYIPLDITERESFSGLKGHKFDAIVLLAGLMPARMKGYRPQSYIDVNVTGTLNVLQYCQHNNVGKIVFAQSHSDMAGYWNTGKVIPRDAPRRLNYLGDHAVYIISKCCAVDLLEHYKCSYGISTVVLRLPTIYCYWPYPFFYVNGEKCPIAYLKFIELAKTGAPIEVWGDPNSVKDIVYVKDFTQIVEKSLAKPKLSGIYNVGSGVLTSLDEQIKGIIRVFSDPRNRSELIYRPNLPSQNSYIYDISDTIRDIGYTPQFSYLAMLKDMKEEMRNDIFGYLLHKLHQ